jgi:phosphatidylethanolamine/phosphatidyl-N-methylethanolamine N-methyltransferase
MREKRGFAIVMAPEHMNRKSVIKTYTRWAPIYDKVFGSVFEEARRAAVEACERIGGRVLEVGVGTGIALPYYSPNCRVTGIDISEAMLEVAKQRVAVDRLEHVESLEVMDAERLAFADASFDVVVAQYVVNTVPDPEAALDEFLRVLRPGGELVIVNRVGASAGPRRALEALFQPFAQRLGWRSEFQWSRFEAWAEHALSAYLIERRPVPPLGHFCLIRFGKSAAAPRAGHNVRQQVARSFPQSTQQPQ